ncbi:hypothetical protein ACFQU7_34365 [Pseudoroseomonas wenyumeiae]
MMHARRYRGAAARVRGMIHNLAKRAHDRNWSLDPIVRSLLDTDWYKLAMLQFIWKHFAGTRVRFTLINRTKGCVWRKWWTRWNCGGSSTMHGGCASPSRS